MENKKQWIAPEVKEIEINNNAGNKADALSPSNAS